MAESRSSGPWLSVREWCDAAKLGAPPASARAWRVTAAAVEPMPMPEDPEDPEDDSVGGKPPRVCRMVISDGGLDREKDIIMPSGWELAAYQANPVVLWAHDYDELPVARDTRTVVEGDRLMGHPQFPEPGLHPFADSVYALLMGGYLRGASVGFQPVEWTYDEGRQGYTITRAELYEWSIVPVPANPRCLIEARSKGIDVAPLRGWAERLLDAAEGPGFWVARSTLEATWRAVTPAATTVMVTPPSALSAPVAPADPSPSIGLAVCPQPPDDLIARAADPDPEVLVLEPDPEAEIDPADLSAALGALIGQAISEAVAEQMTALTGRIAG